MERKVFLEKNRSVSSINRESKLSVGFSNKEKLLKDNNIDTDFSLFEEYTLERDTCEKYRLLLKVNPICSNVLFNTQTEVVYLSGSDSAINITNSSEINPLSINGGENEIQNSSAINRKQAIRDTEYSHEKNGDFTYCCGLDMFNNHQLRATGFVHVNRINELQSQDYLESKAVYNTINDFLRDGSGVIIRADVNPRYNSPNKNTPLHLYTRDSIRTLKNAYKEEIKDKNGWIGFYNKTNIDIQNTDDDKHRINRILNNRKPCEYIDLYPDRTLFSFVPKYNEYRKREERNWDYCITYPYEKDYDIIDTICSGKTQAIRCSVKVAINSTGNNVLECSSLFTHTLTNNTQIHVYYYKPDFNNTLTFTRYDGNVHVYYTGDINGENANHIFALRYEDISDIIDYLTAYGLFYKKVDGGEECEYYARKYKTLYGLNEQGKRLVPLKSYIGKLAFAQNIYGDKIAQVIYTDDIDVSGLKDHHGRPLSEIYFTVVKRNAGYLQWYYQNQPESRLVECSRCFGKVTSGLELYGNDDINFNYNIHKLHNINKNQYIHQAPYNHIYEVLGSSIMSGVPKTIENDITIDDYTFYGNIVEFNKITYEETELTPVYHRFNTAQREYHKNKAYAELFHDEIVNDDYDFTSINSATFSTNESDYAGISVNGINLKTFANLRPEGYYYNPHTKIQIRKESELTTSVKAKYINFISVSGVFDTVKNKTIITAEIPTNYNLLKREHIAIYDRGDGVEIKPVYWGEISNVDGNTIEIELKNCPFYDLPYIEGSVIDVTSILQEETDGVRRFYMFYATDGVPTYAAFVKSNNTFVWRGLDLLSENNNGDELYNIPFANGRLYIEKNINFFVKRQDPSGDFGLQYAKEPEYKNPIEMFNIPGDGFDITQAIDFYNNLNNVCY